MFKKSRVHVFLRTVLALTGLNRATLSVKMDILLSKIGRLMILTRKYNVAR